MLNREVRSGIVLIGCVSVFAIALSLRFWQLDRFDEWIFDEVYYAAFAQRYSQGLPVFDAHPPMGKYLIAVGAELHRQFLELLHLGEASLIGSRPIIGDRWLNALAGSLIPLIVIGIIQVFNRPVERNKEIDKPLSSLQVSALLSGLFVATDGLFITESRHALINIYVVFFGLLGHLCWLLASARQRPTFSRKNVMWLCFAGVSLGLAIATKWNGLGYVLTLWVCGLDRKQHSSFKKHQSRNSQHLAKLLLFSVVVPGLVYYIAWMPHIGISQDSFLTLQRNLLAFHQNLDSTQIACSRWYTWPLLIKPISYAYAEDANVAYTINNLGNPALWILSSAATILSTVVLLSRHLASHSTKKQQTKNKSSTLEINRYLLIGYYTNWLPWVLIERCTYNYLFMPAAAFGFMMLAHLMSQWLSPQSGIASRIVTLAMLGAIALSFFFWLPLALGLSLTPEQLQLRWWLPSWI